MSDDHKKGGQKPERPIEHRDIPNLNERNDDFHHGNFNRIEKGDRSSPQGDTRRPTMENPPPRPSKRDAED